MWPSSFKFWSQPPRQLKTNPSSKNHQFSRRRLHTAIHSGATRGPSPCNFVIPRDTKDNLSHNIFILSIRYCWIYYGITKAGSDSSILPIDATPRLALY